MMGCLKKGMINSAFTISGLLQNNRSIQEDPPLKKGIGLSINWVYPVVEVKETSSLPASEFTSPVHQFLQEA